MFDKELHKEYIFCSYLAHLLPGDETEVWDLGNKVSLEYYKLEETFAGAISLEKDVAGQYEPPTMKKGAAQQEKKSQLEEVIEKFNEHYAGEITSGDRILAGILMDKMSQRNKTESRFLSTAYSLRCMIKRLWIPTRKAVKRLVRCSAILRSMPH